MSPLGKHTNTPAHTQETQCYTFLPCCHQHWGWDLSWGGYNDKCVSFKVLLISAANYTHLLTCLFVRFSLYGESEVEDWCGTVVSICGVILHYTSTYRRSVTSGLCKTCLSIICSCYLTHWKLANITNYEYGPHSYKNLKSFYKDINAFRMDIHPWVEYRFQFFFASLAVLASTLW